VLAVCLGDAAPGPVAEGCRLVRRASSPGAVSGLP